MYLLVYIYEIMQLYFSCLKEIFYIYIYILTDPNVTCTFHPHDALILFETR